jgi:acid phosphatase type 7
VTRESGPSRLGTGVQGTVPCLVLLMSLRLQTGAVLAADVLLEPGLENLTGWDVCETRLPHTGKAAWGVEKGGLVHRQSIEIDFKKEGLEQGYPAGAILVTGQAGWTDYTLRCRVERKLPSRSGLGFIVRYREEGNYAIVWTDDTTTIDIWRFADGRARRLARSGLVRIPYDHVSSIDVQAVGDRITCFINGLKIVEASGDIPPSGKVGFCSVEPNGGRITGIRLIAGAAEPDRPPLEVIKVPYLLYAGNDKACVMWETNRPAGSRVEFVAAGEPPRIAEGQSQGLVHSVVMGGLHTSTKYTFRCTSDGLTAGEGHFVTDVGPTVPHRVGLIGDNRTHPDRFLKLNQYMMKHAPNLVLNVGDICERGSKAHLWDREYFRPNADVTRFAPCYVSIGNHEDNSPWFHHFLPYPGTGTERGHYFAFTYGCVAYLAFDNYHSTLPGSPQYEWIASMLQSDAFRHARWRVVFCHEPSHSVGWESWKEGGNLEVRNFLLPLFEKSKIDVFLNGHTHAYERGILNGIYHIMVGGGGCGDEDFGRNWPHVQVFKLILQYAIMHVSPDRLVIECFDIQDKLVDRVTIAPNRPKMLPGKVVLAPLPNQVPAGKDLALVVSYPEGGRRKVHYRAAIRNRPSRDGFWTPTAATCIASAKTTLHLPMRKPGEMHVIIQALGDELTPTEWTEAPVITVLPPRVPQTDAEYGRRFTATFNAEYLPPWKVEQDTAKGDGEWDVWRGELTQMGKACEMTDRYKVLLGTHVHAGAMPWADYVFRAKVRSDEPGTASLLFRYRDKNNYYRLTCSQDGDFFRLDKRVNGAFATIAEKPLQAWDWRRRSPQDTWHQFVIRVEGNRIVAEIDATQMFDVTDSTFDRGQVGFSTSGCLQFHVDEMSVECVR